MVSLNSLPKLRKQIETEIQKNLNEYPLGRTRVGPNGVALGTYRWRGPVRTQARGYPKMG